MDRRRTRASGDAGNGEPAGAPEPPAEAKPDRARTARVIEETLPSERRAEPARSG